MSIKRLGEFEANTTIAKIIIKYTTPCQIEMVNVLVALYIDPQLYIYIPYICFRLANDCWRYIICEFISSIVILNAIINTTHCLILRSLYNDDQLSMNWCALFNGWHTDKHRDRIKDIYHSAQSKCMYMIWNKFPWMWFCMWLLTITIQIKHTVTE